MAENTELEPGRKSLKPLARLTPFLARYKPQIAKALIALAVASGSALVVPIAVRRIIDHGFTASNATLVNQYFSIMIAVVLLLALSSAIRFYYVMWLGEKITDKGLGNGTSMIIMIGILARLPQAFPQEWSKRISERGAGGLQNGQP